MGKINIAIDNLNRSIDLDHNFALPHILLAGFIPP